jgi:hypothetical protein
VAAPVGTLIALVAAGWFVFAICLVISGAVIFGAALVQRVMLTSWYRRRSGLLSQYAFFALGILLVAAGIPVIILAHPSGAAQPPAKTACTKPAQVSGAGTSAPSFTVLVNLPCAVPSGNQLWVVVQFLNEGVAGTAKHSEYYFAYSVRNDPGSQSFADTPHGCATRRYYLISLTADQLALLQASPHTLAGAYYGEPIDTDINKYIVSNVQINRTCNK